MPSSKALSLVQVGAGKLHPNVASAASDFQTSAGTEAMLATFLASLNQEIAVPTEMDVNLSLTDTSFAVDASVYGPFWLGYTGEHVGDVFDLVDTITDSRVTGTNNLPIYITGITGATIGTGAFTSSVITFNLSAPIPASTQYRFKFSKRTTLGAFTTGALATARRFVPEQPIYEQRFQAMLSNVLVAWDATPTTTLSEAALSGLQERYNRSTSVAGSPTLNSAGDGGLIQRTGQAVTVQATANAYNYSSPQPDPYWANFLVTAGPSVIGTSSLANYDGGTGFVGVLQQRNTVSVSQRTNAYSLSFASRMDVIERDLVASTIGAGNVKTRVGAANSTGTALNPDAGATADDRRTIRLATGDYFWESTSGDDLSEVAVGSDMIEVTLPGGEKQAYVITTLFGGPHAASPVPAEDQRRALVRTIAGDSPEFPSGAATTGVTFRFIKTRHFSGVGTQALRAKIDTHTDPVLLGYGYNAVTPTLTDDPTVTGSDEVDPGHFAFYARARTRAEIAATGFKPYALVFGGHNPRTHLMEARGGLRGDGSIECTLLARQTTFFIIGSATAVPDRTLTWHPSIDGSVVDARISDGVTMVINIDTDYITHVRAAGDTLTVCVNNVSGGAVITWDANFQFQTAGDALPNAGIGSETIWKGIVAGPSNYIYMTKVGEW